MPVTYKSSVKEQLGKYEQKVRTVILKVFRKTSNQWRRRVRGEWLSGPPGIFSGARFGTTGMTRKTVTKRVDFEGDQFLFEANVGGHAPKYPPVVEGVRRVFAEEANAGLETIRSELSVLGRLPPRGVAFSIFGQALGVVDLSLGELYVPEALENIPLRRSIIAAGRVDFVKAAKKKARRGAKARGLVGKENRQARKQYVFRSVKAQIQRNWKKPEVR